MIEKKIRPGVRIEDRSPRIIEPHETGTAIIGKTLVPQMGSDLNTIGKGKIDQRKFAVINPHEQMALMHFSYRGEVDGVRYFKRLVDWMLNSSPSLGGLGRIQTIELTGAASGQTIRDVARRPNILARNTYNRGWEEKARARGQVIEE